MRLDHTVWRHYNIVMLEKGQEKMLDFLKWIATGTLIVGFGFFSAGFDFGWYLQIVGGILWLVAGIKMGDKPIIWTNGAMTAVGILGKLFG